MGICQAALEVRTYDTVHVWSCELGQGHRSAHRSRFLAGGLQVADALDFGDVDGPRRRRLTNEPVVAWP